MLGFVEDVDKFASFLLGTYQPLGSNIPGKYILGFVNGNFSTWLSMTGKTEIRGYLYGNTEAVPWIVLVYIV